MKKLIGFWNQLGHELKMSFIYILDPKLPLWIKIVPFLGIVYVASPIDIIPDFLIGPGILDDFGIIVLSVKAFTKLVNKEQAKIAKQEKKKTKSKIHEDIIEEGEIIKE